MVVYRTAPADLLPLFRTLRQTAEIAAWAVVDNAASEDPEQAAGLRSAVEAAGGRYVAAPGNHGFGTGHNLAVASLRDIPAAFHLFVNPDIAFQSEVVAALLAEMQARPNVVWIMPRVRFPDGSTQHLSKLLPSPLHFAVRRFLPRAVAPLIQEYLDRYELRGSEGVEFAGVPFLSGCFILLRRPLFEQVGGFDERYFLYMEDVDLCRRMAAQGELLYWPGATVTHGWHRGSHNSRSLMLAHLRSSWTYYNQWGWIVDRARARANRQALRTLHKIRAEAKP